MQACRALKAQRRWAVTGTLLQNRIANVYGLLFLHAVIHHSANLLTVTGALLQSLDMNSTLLQNWSCNSLLFCICSCCYRPAGR
jgi:hypothetical protein